MNTLRSRVIPPFVLIVATISLRACPTCTPTERTFLDELTHGARPEGLADIMIVGAFALALVITAVLFLFALKDRRPNEHAS